MNDQLEIPSFKNHKFASPSLTPSNQYRDNKLAIPKVSLPSHVVAPSNYTHKSYNRAQAATSHNIHGRKFDNNSAQIPMNLEAGEVLGQKSQNLQKNKTMISKKILDLAKLKTQKPNPKKKKKTQSQFEFNFGTTKPPLKSRTNNATIDFEGLKRPGTVAIPQTTKAGTGLKKIRSEGKKNVKQMLNKTTMLIKKDDKENWQGERATSQQNRRKPKSTHYRNMDGLSISSFSSNSGGRSKNDPIAKQLSKNYFLNPQQLLRHLSPPRNESQATKMQNTTILESSISQRKGRNRSTTAQTGLYLRQSQSHRRNNSHSTSRKYNTDLHTLREPKNVAAPPAKSKSGGGLLPKKTLDKIIKQNIKKNKSKQNQEATKKLLEQQKIKQRKAELTQRNQQVRLQNASKVNKTERGRSKSCITQQLKTHTQQKSSSSERKVYHSQGKQLQLSPKTVPLTTTNKLQKERPKNFVDEIKQLTNEVSLELGHPNKVNHKKLSYSHNETALKELLQKPQQSQKRKAAQIQKFIERKKREDEIKKSLEKSIQVDKQKKIQKNLDKLDKFVKKHVRQKSHNSFEVKKASMVIQRKKKNKASMDVNGNKTATPINLSLLMEDTMNKSIKQNKPRAVVSSAGTRAGTTASGKVGGQKRKTSANSSSMIANHKRQITLQPTKDYQTQLIPASNSQNISNARNNQKIPIKTSISSKDTTFLSRKHPEHQVNSVATPSLNVEEAKLPTSSSKQTGKIRRVHELVALYRSKFKPNISDASVMGTLHAAASVIQIHFRYMKQLREAAKQKKDDIESFINSEASSYKKNVTPANEEVPPKAIHQQQEIKQEPKPLNIPELELFRIQQLQEENKKQSKTVSQADSSQRTVSTYRGIFNRIGLPLSRSARVKVEYDLVEKDPKICEQLKEIVKMKEERGKQVISEGRKDNLISDRTFQKNIKKLERWVTSSYNKIEKGMTKSSKRLKQPEELIEEAVEQKKRTEQIIDTAARSARSFSARQSGRQSWRGPTQQITNEDSQTDRDPYQNDFKRPSLADVLKGESSKLSSQSKVESPVNEPTKLEDIQIQIDLADESQSENHHTTEKSLNRQESYPFQAATTKDQLMNIPSDKLNEDSEKEYKESDDSPATVNPDNIQLQFEDPKDSDKKSRLQDIRDPSFFSRQVDEEFTYNENQDFNLDELLDQSNLSVSEGRKPNPFNKTNNMKDLLKQEQTLVDYSDHEIVSSGESAKKEDSPPKNEAIKVENQKQPTINTQQQTTEPDINHVSSPTSDKNLIHTGALSLSSTDSDMVRAIQAANKEIRENSSPEQANKNEELADSLTDLIFNKFMVELGHEIEIIVPRCEQLSQSRHRPSLKFFEKKGIKTDLFAIERYVDEILEEVKLNQKEFMKEVNKPLTKDQVQVLFQMQNSEIGSYEHFQSVLPPVLSLDLYLRLEKRRKDSREHAKDPAQPNGLFDFENVNDAELREDGVDRNFLAECQHIHNKVLFDCINDSLQQFRPHGKDGYPMDWSRTGRKLKPTEDFSLEEMLEITKHDLFRMAIMQAGTLPRREFVFSGHFDEDLFQEIREKKLATLLCREIVENEQNWLKWEFEEAQTKIDLGDMVLEALVTETIQFLQQKQKSQAQQNFESLQSMIIKS